MKSKKLKKILGGLGATLLLETITPARAQEDPIETLKDKPRVGVYLEQANKYKSDAGFTILDSPVTNANVGASYGKWSGFVWAAHNNVTNDINEVDVGIGYSFGSENGKFSGRVGFERWMFTEDGGNTELFIGDLGYNNGINFSVNVKQVLDADGTSYRIGAERTFNIGRKKLPLTLTPYAKTSCLDNFFGVTKCPSNSVFGASLETKIGDYPVLFSGEYHKGEGDFKDDLVGRLKINFDLF